MNNTTPSKSKPFAVIIGVIVSVILAAGGYYIVQNLASNASDSAPRDVVVSEISQNSAQVIWGTGSSSQGVIEYGTSPTNLNFFAPESEKSQEHKVDLTLLSPSTTYYFQIRIADKKYDNSGVPWTFTTKATASDNNTDITPGGTGKPASTFKTSPTCNETDCEKIKQKFFSGCDTQDYVKCVKAKEATQ